MIKKIIRPRANVVHKFKVIIVSICLVFIASLSIADILKEGYGSVLEIRGGSGEGTTVDATLIQMNEGVELAHGSCPQENWGYGNRVVWAIDNSDTHIVSMALTAFASVKDIRILGDSTISRIGNYCKVTQISVKQ